MGEINILAVGALVIILFGIGVFHTVKEFKEMYNEGPQGLERERKLDVDYDEE